jgi:hypothetical protein
MSKTTSVILMFSLILKKPDLTGWPQEGQAGMWRVTFLSAIGLLVIRSTADKHRWTRILTNEWASVIF